jgi:hypothetical protein
MTSFVNYSMTITLDLRDKEWKSLKKSYGYKIHPFYGQVIRYKTSFGKQMNAKLKRG